MSGMASTFPFKNGKIHTKSDTIQTTNYEGNKTFMRGLSCYTTAGIVYVRMKGVREDPNDNLNFVVATYPAIVYLALGSYFIGEFDIVYSTGATAVDFMVWW